MSVTVAKYYPGKKVEKNNTNENNKQIRQIIIHTPSMKRLGVNLSPYCLKNEKGQLLENIWQFSKVYPHVYSCKQPLSRFHQNTIIWEHKEEDHIVNGVLTPEYFEWREKGMNNQYAVRYPNGLKHRGECLYSYWEDEKLDYITARKRIYCGEYARLAPKVEDFKKLKKLLNSGTNLQIIEVDGPDPNLNYPPYNQINKDNPGLTINEENIKLLLNDPNKPFGHGYTIAALLLDGEDWLK